MGNDKDQCVVDKDLKIYGTKNIFICGSSVFPINGITNPTWTIMTLANRLSKHLLKVCFVLMFHLFVLEFFAIGR